MTHIKGIMFLAALFLLPLLMTYLSYTDSNNFSSYIVTGTGYATYLILLMVVWFSVFIYHVTNEMKKENRNENTASK